MPEETLERHHDDGEEDGESQQQVGRMVRDDVAREEVVAEEALAQRDQPKPKSFNSPVASFHEIFPLIALRMTTAIAT